MFFLISYVFENTPRLHIKTSHPCHADRGGFCVV